MNKTTGISQWEHPLRRTSAAQGMISTSVAEEDPPMAVNAVFNSDVNGNGNGNGNGNNGIQTPKGKPKVLQQAATPIVAVPPSDPPPAHLVANQKSRQTEKLAERAAQEEQRRQQQPQTTLQQQNEQQQAEDDLKGDSRRQAQSVRQQRLQSESLLAEFFALLQSKAGMQKKMGNEGKYYDRTIFVRSDLREFCWAKPGAKEGVAKGIPFEDIIEVRIGPPNKVARNRHPGLSDNCCFSVIHKNGSIDLTMENETKVSKYEKALTSMVIAHGSFNGSTKEFLESLQDIENRLKNITLAGSDRNLGAGNSPERRASGPRLVTVIGKGDDDEVIEQPKEQQVEDSVISPAPVDRPSQNPDSPNDIYQPQQDQMLEQRKRTQTRESISQYAADHFASHKRWATYRNVAMTPKEMVSWSTIPLKTPLNPMSSVAKEKVAIEIFRAVCAAMGEDGHNGVVRNPTISPTIVVNMAGDDEELIDEIYCQLMKQTTSNPNPASDRRGWQILAACAAAYLPNSELCECVCKHANRKRFQSDAVGGLSFFVFQRVMLGEGKERGNGEGGKVATIELNKDDIEDIESCYIPDSVYGVGLEGVLRKELFTRSPQAAMPPPQSLLMKDGMEGIPIILQLLCRTILQLGGANTEGIFRLAALKDDIDWIKEEISGGDYRAINLKVTSKPKVSDPLVAADLLKTWLREMPESLFEGSIYERCIAAGRSKTGKESLKMLQLIKPSSRACVVFICNFLKKLSEAHAVTKMTVDNLALVFAPNLLKNPSNDPMVFATNSDSEKRFIKYLIAEANTL